MKKTRTVQRMIALSLSLVAVAGFSACSNNNRPASEAPGGMSEVRGYDDVANVDQVNKPTQTQSGTPVFNTLKKGQPVNYYTHEFESMGYSVEDVTRSGNRVTYDLRRDTGNTGERMLVTLTTDERNNQLVNDVSSRQYRRLSGDKNDKDISAIVSEVEKLQPGKKPIEYLPMLSKWGEVREFEAEDKEASVELRTASNREFEVEMTVNPQTKLVSDIRVDNKNFWSL